MKHPTDGEIEDRRRRFLEEVLPELKAKARAQAQRRGLASFMNETRWRELRRAVEEELPFVPAVQVQNILLPPEPLARITECASGHSWDHEDIPPFALIEWMRLVPRRYEFTGMLTPYRLVEDCGDQLREILTRLSIPFREDDDRTFWIYGYASADPAALAPPAG